VRPKASWTCLSAAFTNTTAARDCQTPSGQIPGDQPDEELLVMDGKTLKKDSIVVSKLCLYVLF